MTEDFTIASGAYALPARLYRPAGAAKAAYVLHPATGVPRDYYAAFCDWVAGQGFAILSYGYRSDGASADALKGSRIRMSDWGIADQNAALNALADRCPGLELRVIGHSLGGFMTMFHDRASEVASLSAVCSGPAYWRRSPRARRAGVWGFWFVLGPLATFLRGYLPGRLLGGSEDLPKTAFAQWKAWCGNPELHRPFWGRDLPTPDISAFAGRLNLIGVSDDWQIPPEVVSDLRSFYPAARPQMQVIEARDRPIGHLSVFRPRHAEHWPKLL